MILRTPKLGFNPRTREGATVTIASFSAKNAVSIHAPVRVRPYSRFITRLASQFQSTHP